MANHKSALKRAKQNEIKRTRNKAVKTKVKHVVKDIRLAASGETTENLAAKLVEVQSIIDKASNTNAMHKKTAARKISRLAKMVNTVSA